MSQITRVSMKGVKMYKHIVQSVERFIVKVSFLLSIMIYSLKKVINNELFNSSVGPNTKFQEFM